MSASRGIIAAGFLAVAAITGCASASSSAGQSGPDVPWTCGITQGGYSVVAHNDGNAAVQITGFSVVLMDHGQESGSDNDPGNGYVNGTDLIGMNDWLAAGQTLAFDVQPDNPMPAAVTCQVVQWDSQ